jgi:hypothetical protein
MVRFKNIITGTMIVVIGVGVALYLFPSEEKKIKKQFRLLAEWVSKDPGENTLTTAYKIRNIGTLFDKSCEFEIPAYSFSGDYTPDDISGYAAQGRLLSSQLHLKFYDLAITFPENGIAKVTLTARLTGKLSVGDTLDETHELESVLKKTEKKWLFSRFEVVEVLKK